MEIAEPDLFSYCTHGDLEWHGCYGSGAKYNRYTVPESISHPAKMSYELLERIFKHLESMELLDQKSTIIDFMAGTGRTGTMAALRGYKTISVELEPKFIQMIAGYDCDGLTINDFLVKPCICQSGILHNSHKIRTGLFEVECSGNPRIVPVCRCGTKIHHKKHHIPGNRELLEKVTGRHVKWDVIMGDARQLRRLMNLTNLVGLVSPPYFNQVAFQDKEFIKSIAEDKSQRYRDGRLKGHYGSPEAIKRYTEKLMGSYSTDERNIGNLPDGPLVGLISPPYQDMAMPMGVPSHIRKLAKEGNWIKAIELERKCEEENVRKGNKYGISTDETFKKKIEASLNMEQGNYSGNPENIGNLKDSPLIGITSPPYGEAQQGAGIVNNGYDGPHIHEMGKNQPAKVGKKCGYLRELHGNNPANIGNITDSIKNIVGESYLTAMLEVYYQAYICGISPLIVVTKNPTRNGKLRRLDLDTIKILQLAGYEIFDYHRAILFDSHKQETLDGCSKTLHKGRISFFKRLALEKGGTVAQWEDVIFARIPQ
ncbi:MAG: DNA methyltransferase [Desulfocapsaceae bacterium]|nr:DNA methyltransferase [Desulfocapsaceae bacterium]